MAVRALIVTALASFAAAKEWATGQAFIVGLDQICPNPQTYPPKPVWQTSPQAAGSCQSFSLTNVTTRIFSTQASCDMDTNSASATIYNSPDCTGQAYIITTAGAPSPKCYPGVMLFDFINVQSFAIDCKSTPGSSTSGTIIGLCVVISVGLAVLILYWVWQDKVAKKKVVDTTGTVAHYQALEAAEKGGH